MKASWRLICNCEYMLKGTFSKDWSMSKLEKSIRRLCSRLLVPFGKLELVYKLSVLVWRPPLPAELLEKLFPLRIFSGSERVVTRLVEARLEALELKPGPGTNHVVRRQELARSWDWADNSIWMAEQLTAYRERRCFIVCSPWWKIENSWVTSYQK